MSGSMLSLLRVIQTYYRIQNLHGFSREKTSKTPQDLLSRSPGTFILYHFCSQKYLGGKITWVLHETDKVHPFTDCCKFAQLVVQGLDSLALSCSEISDHLQPGSFRLTMTNAWETASV